MRRGMRANVREDKSLGIDGGLSLRLISRVIAEGDASRGRASRDVSACVNRKRWKFERGINSLSVKVIRIQYRIFVLAGYERNGR